MIFDGKLYLNLEKQVQKNKDDIEYLINEEGALNQFGLRVVGQVESVADMPTIQAYKESNPNWEYGDAFMAGVSTEEATVVDVEDATLLVLTRANTVYPNDFWMNLGKFPKPGPQGIQGIQGEQGKQGEQGLGIETSFTDPTGKALPAGTTWINATTGDVFVILGNGSYTKMGNIKGATGSVGATGPQGATGPIGPTGATGPQGPRGIGVNILGTLTSTSQLPGPTTVAKDSAYIIPADGVNHLWVIEGTTSLVWTDFGTAGLGEKGEKGDDGVGIDTMTDIDLTYGNTTVTYDTTDGMNINGQARFTYNGGKTKDVTMDIEVPIVAGEGIVLDKVDEQEKVEVKLDTAFTDGKYVAKGTLPKAVYTRDSNGNESMISYTENATAWAMAQRAAGGVLRVGTPSGDNDAAPKKYVDDGFVARQTPASGTHVYSTKPDGTQGTEGLSATAQAYTIAYRYEDGRLAVGTPVGVSDATTKAYVDAIKRYFHHITVACSAGTVCLTIETTDGTAIDTQASLMALFDTLTTDTLSATGHIGGNMVYAVYGGGTMFVKMYNFTSEQDVEEDMVNYGTLTVTDVIR